jgi:hypothetical protein
VIGQAYEYDTQNLDPVYALYVIAYDEPVPVSALIIDQIHYLFNTRPDMSFDELYWEYHVKPGEGPVLCRTIDYAIDGGENISPIYMWLNEIYQSLGVWWSTHRTSPEMFKRNPGIRVPRGRFIGNLIAVLKYLRYPTAIKLLMENVFCAGLAEPIAHKLELAQIARECATQVPPSKFTVSLTHGPLVREWLAQNVPLFGSQPYAVGDVVIETGQTTDQYVTRAYNNEEWGKWARDIGIIGLKTRAALHASVLDRSPETRVQGYGVDQTIIWLRNRLSGEHAHERHEALLIVTATGDHKNIEDLFKDIHLALHQCYMQLAPIYVSGQDGALLDLVDCARHIEPGNFSRFWSDWKLLAGIVGLCLQILVPHPNGFFLFRDEFLPFEADIIPAKLRFSTWQQGSPEIWSAMQIWRDNQFLLWSHVIALLGLFLDITDGLVTLVRHHTVASTLWPLAKLLLDYAFKDEPYLLIPRDHQLLIPFNRIPSYIDGFAIEGVEINRFASLLRDQVLHNSVLQEFIGTVDPDTCSSVLLYASLNIIVHVGTFHIMSVRTGHSIITDLPESEHERARREAVEANRRRNAAVEFVMTRIRANHTIEDFVRMYDPVIHEGQILISTITQECAPLGPNGETPPGSFPVRLDELVDLERTLRRYIEEQAVRSNADPSAIARGLASARACEIVNQAGEIVTSGERGSFTQDESLTHPDLDDTYTREDFDE